MCDKFSILIVFFVLINFWIKLKEFTIFIRFTYDYTNINFVIHHPVLFRYGIVNAVLWLTRVKWLENICMLWNIKMSMSSRYSLCRSKCVFTPSILKIRVLYNYSTCVVQKRIIRSFDHILSYLYSFYKHWIQVNCNF